MNNNTCIFFGHRDCPQLDTERLRDAVEKLIREGVDTFYVGNNGRFDAAVRSLLKRLKVEYPHIKYWVVLAYLPTKKEDGEDYSDTLLPDFEQGPPRFAIDRRNRWLVDRADHVICYVTHSHGAAYKFSRLAQKLGKKVYNLCDSFDEL